MIKQNCSTYVNSAVDEFLGFPDPTQQWRLNSIKGTKPCYFFKNTEYNFIFSAMVISKSKIRRSTTIKKTVAAIEDHLPTNHYFVLKLTFAKVSRCVWEVIHIYIRILIEGAIRVQGHRDCC